MYWSKYDKVKEGNDKIHRVIAALICHQEGKLPYAAILGAGTKHNIKKCFHTKGTDKPYCNHLTCDGHAESIVYEGIPKYFHDQMVCLCKEGETSDSIFKKISSDKEPLMFELKPNIKFYLMVTKSPCGFITHKENPCMEWKVPFYHFPHIPTCSSRILIGARMGIQGYVSHLLSKPIFIDSVVILCANSEEPQKLEFDRSFQLPEIKTRKYNPNDFSSFNEQKDSKIKSTEHGLVTVTSPYPHDGPSYAAINVQTGKEKPYNDGILISKKEIEDCLRIDDMEKMIRMQKYKKLYNELCEQLGLQDALKILRDKLIIKYKKNAKSIEKCKNNSLEKLKKITPNKLSQSTETKNIDKACKDSVKVYKRAKDDINNGIDETNSMADNKKVVSYIDDLLSSQTKLIMDCTWECYFRSVNKLKKD